MCNSSTFLDFRGALISGIKSAASLNNEEVLNGLHPPESQTMIATPSLSTLPFSTRNRAYKYLLNGFGAWSRGHIKSNTTKLIRQTKQVTHAVENIYVPMAHTCEVVEQKVSDL